MSVQQNDDGSVVVKANTQGPMQGVKLTPSEEGVIVVSGSGDSHIFDTVPALLDSDAALELGEALCAMAVKAPGSPEVETIRCRSQKSPACYDGKPAEPVYGPEGMAADNTFKDGTVVCDACYIALGTPTIRELKEKGL